jgi:hypothetical protein
MGSPANQLANQKPNNNPLYLVVASFYILLYFGTLSLLVLPHSFLQLPPDDSVACFCRLPAFQYYLYGIMEILTTFPTHILSAPHSLVLLAVMIQGDFQNIIFFILSCTRCRLDFWHISQNLNQHALEKIELACIIKM